MLRNLGIAILCLAVLGVLGGSYLDRRVGGGGALVAVGVLLGLGAGIYGAYALLRGELPWNR